MKAPAFRHALLVLSTALLFGAYGWVKYNPGVAVLVFSAVVWGANARDMIK